MTAALRRHDSRDKRIERLERENATLRRENDRLRDKTGCNPPPEFERLYDELWERAYGTGKRWVHESTAAGSFSLKRKTFRDLCRDERAVDDIIALDKLFRALSIPVHGEARRREDVALWHREIAELIRVWRERYRPKKEKA